jgi:general secretion pathway protein G
MRQRIRAIRQSDSGFTLIELLIVIVILGVLAGVVVFAVNGISDRGLVSACKSDKKIVEVAAEAAYANDGAYPADIDALKAGGYIHDVPDNVNNKYTITYTATAASVTVTGDIKAVAGAGTNCEK